MLKWQQNLLFSRETQKSIKYLGFSGFFFNRDKFNFCHRVLGTPTEETWPGVSQLKEYKTSFPNFCSQGLESFVNLNDEGMDLLKRMLKLNPTDRISAKSAMNHVKYICF